MKLVTIILCLMILAGAAVGQTIFEQDFNMGSDAGFSPDGSGWFVTPEGEYSVDNTGYEIFAWSYVDGEFWNDYIFSYDLKSIDSVNQLAAFRVESIGNCYVLNMRAAPYNDIGITKWINGIQHHIHTQPYENTGGIWHHFDIMVTAAEITVYADEMFQFTITDTFGTPYYSGGIAAVSYSGGVVTHQTLFMDNISVGSGSVATEPLSWSGVKALFLR